ncbi:RICIN domain-containing protein [Spongiivirga citrea]|uniref:Ricin B lectin domain-containing protein n=1 Tax=Spongiivirga citrea TaxID=1481457 RepID=A0A6M0CMZ6_9FLAO|nr:RICIN domain-containing protein [Spongiivirga citrea]NER19052.1 hypothetical protein [Spongiivirga citrea]
MRNSINKITCFFAILLILNIHFASAQKNGGEYYIISALENKALDVQWGKSKNGTPFHLWSQNQGLAQRFTLENAGNGYFYIKSALGKYMHVYGGRGVQKAKVTLWDKVNQDNLKWKFVPGADGYFYIQSKLGTFLDVQWGNAKNGTPIWMWDGNKGNAQKWKLKLTKSLLQIKMTTFSPKDHGFKFSNKFKSTVGDAGSIKFTFNGLCGGMAYAANDYFLSSKAIPKQTYQPAIGTTLHKYIYERQQNSLSNLDKFLEFSFNPFGSRDREFFYWGLEGRLYELKRLIDNNMPIPLGLFNVHNDPTSHHQVLAIGYDLGGYIGKKDRDPNQENVKIFIYDPNYPGEVCALIPVPNEAAYHQYRGKFENNKFILLKKCSKKWRSYFLDKKFKKRTPPKIKQPVKTESDKINRLLFTIRTGGDDLRGGNDNVDIHIEFKNGTKQSVLNANGKNRWPDNHNQIVEVYLDKPVNRNQIDCIKLQTTFGGGMFGDNWNMDYLKIEAFAGDTRVDDIYQKSGRPLKRFTGDHQWFSTK